MITVCDIFLFTQTEEHNKCKLPADVGFCRSFQERFYYDSIESQCKVMSLSISVTNIITNYFRIALIDQDVCVGRMSRKCQ